MAHSETELSAGCYTMPCIWMKRLKCVPLLSCFAGHARMFSASSGLTRSYFQKDSKVCFDHYFQRLSSWRLNRCIRKGLCRVTLLLSISSTMTWQYMSSDKDTKSTKKETPSVFMAVILFLFYKSLLFLHLTKVSSCKRRCAKVSPCNEKSWIYLYIGSLYICHCIMAAR